MILEIALGIVLAVIILSLLPLIITVGVGLLVLAIAIALIAAAVMNWQVVLGLIGGALILGVALGVPALLVLGSRRRWPAFAGMLDAAPPYNTWKFGSLRVLVVLLLTVSLSGVAYGLLTLGVKAFDHIEKRINPAPLSPTPPGRL